VLAADASAIIIGGRGHALLPLAAQQVGRIYVTNIGNPNEDKLVCGVIIDWVAADGSAIGDPGILEVRPRPRASSTSSIAPSPWAGGTP
jgi:hypothetical protein